MRSPSAPGAVGSPSRRTRRFLASTRLSGRGRNRRHAPDATRLAAPESRLAGCRPVRPRRHVPGGAGRNRSLRRRAPDRPGDDPGRRWREANYLYTDRPELLDDPFFARALHPGLRAQFADAAWRKRALYAAAASREEVAVNQRNLKALRGAGVRIGFGTDSGATALRIPGFAEHRELDLMVGAGPTPEEALRCATARSAELLSLQGRGLLRQGRRAGILVLDADPLVDPGAARRIRAV